MFDQDLFQNVIFFALGAGLGAGAGEIYWSERLRLTTLILFSVVNSFFFLSQQISCRQ